MNRKRSGLAAFGFIAKKQKSIIQRTSLISAPSSGSATNSSTVAKVTANVVLPKASRFDVFCDLDGVLVGFEAEIRKLFNGRGPDEIPNQGHMWAAISRHPSFYADLPWTEDGRELWDAIKHLNPSILTGVPRTKKSRLEKATWCKRELGVETNHVDMAGKRSTHERQEGQMREGVVNVITCWSKNKHMESGKHA